MDDAGIKAQRNISSEVTGGVVRRKHPKIYLRPFWSKLNWECRQHISSKTKIFNNAVLHQHFFVLPVVLSGIRTDLLFDDLLKSSWKNFQEENDPIIQLRYQTIPDSYISQHQAVEFSNANFYSINMLLRVGKSAMTKRLFLFISPWRSKHKGRLAWTAHSYHL